MDAFTNIRLLDYDSEIDVEGGRLQLSGIESLCRVRLLKMLQHTDCEESDLLQATIQFNDSSGAVWGCSREVFASAFWIENADDDIVRASDWRRGPVFEQTPLIQDVYGHFPVKSWKKHVIGGNVVEVSKKYLSYHYDVAYDVDEMEDGEPVASVYVPVRLFAETVFGEEPVYYTVYLFDALSAQPFRKGWLFQRTGEYGKPQPGIHFVAR